MTSQAGLQSSGIHILPNVSINKGNQTMKFGQLIEYRIFLLKNHSQNVPDPYLQNQNSAYL